MSDRGEGEASGAETRAAPGGGAVGSIWALGVLGWVTSWALMGRWLLAHGGPSAFFAGWADAFTASDFATGLLLDLVVVSLMMIALAVIERRRVGGKAAVAMVASLSISVSMSLAIYLAALWRWRAAAMPSADEE